MSLRMKMILGIGAVLLLVILVYTILASSIQVNRLMLMARQEADLIAEVSVRALARAMERGETHVVQAILTRIGRQPVLAGIRIVAADGTILRASKPEEEGQVLSPEELPKDATFSEPVWNLRERTVGVFLPIPNRPSCARCHQRKTAVLGYLNAQVYVPSADLWADPHWMYMIVIGVAGLIAAGGMIWLFFSLVAGQRIHTLSRTMSLVEAGDLTARVPDDSRDELGRSGQEPQRHGGSIGGGPTTAGRPPCGRDPAGPGPGVPGHDGRGHRP